jgi:hypothetical protein
LIERDFTREQRQDFSVRKEILLELPDTTDIGEMYRLEVECIVKHQANNPAIGYNWIPKWNPADGNRDDRQP